MARITINEISDNYSYSTGTSTYCTVALPITASWGPAYEDPAALGIPLSEELEACAFSHFPSTQNGLESFIATYRGPSSNYRSAKDYSYQLALTLLTAGYDLDVCRVCPGTHAQATLTGTTGTGEGATTGTLTVKAKYPGTFGNNLFATLKKVANRNYWNLIVYVVDSAGTKTAVENKIFVFDLEHSTDTILHISELESAFVNIVVDGIESDDVVFSGTDIQPVGGTDRSADGTATEMMDNAIEIATRRFGEVPEADGTDYIAALNTLKASNPSISRASSVRYMEWVYEAAFNVLGILTDKLSYTSSRIALPGWDDQNITEISGELVTRIAAISPLHARLLNVAYNSRCGVAYLDIPKCLPRSQVYNDSTDPQTEGYVQKIARYLPQGMNDALFSTHGALFGPWGQYRYVGTSRNNICPPSFLALMIQIGMIKNQSLQYEWAMPTTRKHNLSIGKLDYTVPKALLDEWQSNEGASINVITDIPDLGVTVWGNSTCYEVPPATYNALQNLSTRWLLDAVKDLAFRAGISITFQYNNQEAYSKFFAAMTPLLDTMKSVGAITGYDISMAPDINGLDSVNANSVVGQITLYVVGVIGDITIDLIALPAVD